METINELTTVIHQEADLAESMDALLKLKQNAFVQWKPQDLENVVKEEESFLNQMTALERRVFLVSQLTSNGEQKKLSEIAEAFNANDLRIQAQRLRAASQRVMEKNGQNKQLLQQSLGFVQHTLAILTNNFQRQLVDQKA